MRADSGSELRPGLDTLMVRATALLPVLRERALGAEQSRCLDADTFARLRAAGFGRICQPIRFGGYELGLDAACEVIMELGRACGSTAWIANLMAVHNFQASMFPLEAQQEYFAKSDVFSSTASWPATSKMTECRGGVRLSGRWKHAAGADFADWFIVMKPAADSADWLLVPRCDVALVDEWHVVGLCGTGSQDVLLDDVFVPAHRRLSIQEISSGTTPGAKLYEDPFYRVPFFSPAPLGFCAALIGIVTGIVDEFEQAMPLKQAISARQKESERHSHQAQLAKARVDLVCARHLLHGAAKRIRDWGSGVPQGASDQHVARRDYCYAARLMTQTAHELFLAGGSSAVLSSSPMQRLMRDAYAAGAHSGLNWGEAAEAYGRACWGVASKPN